MLISCIYFITTKYLLLGGEDIRISSISDGEDRAVEDLSASSSKSSVVSIVVVNIGLGKHGNVLNLGSAKRRAVVGDEDHLSLSFAHALQGCLVSKGSLSGLHNQLDAGVHGVYGLLLFSGRV